MMSARTPGASHQQARQRLQAGGFWLPRLLTDGADASASTRAIKSFTAHASVAHSVGAWVEIVTALSEDVGWVRISSTFSTGATGADTSTLFNLGIGASSAETTILPSLGVGYSILDASTDQSWMFPIYIPKGTRVAGQIQSAALSKVYEARFEFFAPTHGLIPSNKIIAMGANTATSKGVNLSTPGAINTEGAWTEIISATTETYEALMVSVQGGADTSHANANVLLDIGIGANPNEVAIITNLGFEAFTSETIRNKNVLVHPAFVPKGSRLVARWQGSATTGTFDVILHGIRKAA